MAEVTAFGNTVKQYVPGLPDSMISVDGNWDSALDAQLSPMVGFDTTAISWEFDPEGTASTRIRYTGTCFLASYNATSPINGKDAVTFTLQQASNITRATIP